MKKDRFVAFFDAIMAIIMTIVVLEFVIPSGTNWEDLESLLFQIIAYGVSFFWLGAMWINIHEIWGRVDLIDRATLWTNIVMLFFASMIPFFTVYFGRNLMEKVPAILYATDVLLLSLTNVISVECLARHNESVKNYLPTFRRNVIIDLLIKSICFIIAFIIFPPATLIGVLGAALYLIISRFINVKKKTLKKEKNNA